MNWATLIQLLATWGPRGFDLAEKLIEKWNSPEPVTAADIAELKALGLRTPRDAVVEALARAGVPMDSEKAKEMLAMLPS